MIRSVLDMVTDLSKRCGLSQGRTCSAFGIAVSSWHRWQHRTRTGVPLLKRPGPRKVQAADIAAINRDVLELGHGARRTEGVTALYKQYRNTISRRELAALVAEVRKEKNRDIRLNQRRLHWHGAGVVWAIDDTEYLPDSTGCKAVINHIEDLGSKYNLEPMSGECQACGEEIAGHLAHLICKYDAPLFFKRDNAKNLNHSVIDDVLAEHIVLPLNSPAYYPPYNGAIEKAQDEFKTELARQLTTGGQWQASAMEPSVRVTAHELNHATKPSLNGQTACHVFFNQRISFNKRERKEIYDWIKSRQNYILENVGFVSKEAAWRYAAEAWLIQHGFLTVTINNRVLPSFYRNLSHYL